MGVCEIHCLLLITSWYLGVSLLLHPCAGESNLPGRFTNPRTSVLAPAHLSTWRHTGVPFLEEEMHLCPLPGGAAFCSTLAQSSPWPEATSVWAQSWSGEGLLLAKLRVWQAPQEGVPRACTESLAAARD